jgi:outer membrane protein assembly factor BamD
MQKTAPSPLPSRFFSLAVLLFLTLSLSACGSLWPFGSQNKEEVFEPVESLIAKGMKDYNVGNYSDALKAFQEAIDRYPFSPQATLAELKAADSLYYNGKYREAKELYKAFEERHPTNEAIPYVMFQIGMCDYVSTDRIDRDASGAHEAVHSFSRLLRAYPHSPYTQEASARRDSAREFIVNHEYFIAVFYVRTKKYDQALHRLEHLITLYPEASITPKAKELRDRLQAGDPPRWGLNRWLPDLTLPSWRRGDISHTETGRQAESNAHQQ